MTARMPSPSLHRRARGAQRGVASLIVVALLFFILSMVAAYTNRNLIFEQRTSGNQYRSTMALEAAEAGLEWALALLNGGRIDAACAPSVDAADTPFRERYLSIDPVSGVITPTGALAPDGGGQVWASCVFDGTDRWTCSCPQPGNAPVLDMPGGAGLHPAFRLRFVRTGGGQPGIVRLEANACTRLDNNCLDFPARATTGEGRATVSSLIALRGGLAAAPVAALTVRQNVDVGGAALGAFNSDVRTGGLAILAGGSVATGGLRLGGAPGTPPENALVELDAQLAALPSAERFFSSNFATTSDTWRDQPGTVRLDCALVACDGDAVRAVAQQQPGRVVWVDGNVVLDGGTDIGSAAVPLVLVATGNIEVGAGVTFHGLLYSQAATWNTAGSGTVRGAALAGNALGGTGSISVVYDADVLNRLRLRTGSFVRVPGGWRDF